MNVKKAGPQVVRSADVLSFDRGGRVIDKWLQRAGDHTNGSAIAIVGDDAVVRFWYMGRNGIACDPLSPARLRMYRRVTTAATFLDPLAVDAEFRRLQDLKPRFVRWHMPVSWLLSFSRSQDRKIPSLILRALILPIASTMAISAHLIGMRNPPALVCSSAVYLVLRNLGYDLPIRLTLPKGCPGPPSRLDRLLARYFVTPADIERAFAQSSLALAA